MKIAACSFILSLSVIAGISIFYGFNKPTKTSISLSENAPNVANGVALLGAFSDKEIDVFVGLLNP